MAAGHRRQVIVGVNGSLTSLRALRQAVDEASRRQAELTVIHVRPPARPNAQAALIGFPDPTPWPGDETSRSLDREAEALIATCIDEGLGGLPAGVAVRIVVDVGIPQVCLAHQTPHDDDLLVVGTRGSRRWTRLWRRSISKYCISHAACPVLVVPPDSFARTVQSERRWHRSLWRRDLWKQFAHCREQCGRLMRDCG
jgi:nucleotide-binding universal stress UspA family protein